MTKKKKLLNGIIFLVGLIVFVVYYFKDNTDMEKVEKAQDESAKDSAEVKLPDLSEDLAEFEAINNAGGEDSVIVDSL